MANEFDMPTLLYLFSFPVREDSDEIPFKSMKFSHTEDQAREIIQIYNNDHKGLREIFINDESHIVSDKER